MNKMSRETDASSHQDRNQGASIGALMVAGTGVGGIGCAIPILIVASIFLGRWLDDLFNSDPLVTLALIVASIIVGVGYLFFAAYQAARDAHSQYIRSVRAAQKSRHDNQNPQISRDPRRFHEEDNR